MGQQAIANSFEPSYLASRRRAKKKTRTYRGTYKDILILFLKDGLPAVQEAFQGKAFSVEQMEHAARSADDQSFLAFVKEQQQQRTDLPRGRLAPSPGMVRDYVPQKDKNGMFFIHLPIGPLSVKKKTDMVKVSFLEGQIVATRVDAEA